MVYPKAGCPRYVHDHNLDNLSLRAEAPSETGVAAEEGAEAKEDEIIVNQEETISEDAMEEAADIEDAEKEERDGEEADKADDGKVKEKSKEASNAEEKEKKSAKAKKEEKEYTEP